MCVWLRVRGTLLRTMATVWRKLGLYRLFIYLFCPSRVSVQYFYIFTFLSFCLLPLESEGNLSRHAFLSINRVSLPSIVRDERSSFPAEFSRIMARTKLSIEEKFVCFFSSSSSFCRPSSSRSISQQLSRPTNSRKKGEETRKQVFAANYSLV